MTAGAGAVGPERHWERIFQWPILSYVTLVVTLWLGVYANSHSAELLAGLGDLSPRNAIAWRAVAFWSTALIVALTSVLSQVASSRDRSRVDRLRKAAEEELKAAITKSQQARESAEIRLSEQLAANEESSREAVSRQLELTTKLQDETTRLAQLVRTMPPETTLPLVADFLTVALQELLDVVFKLLAPDENTSTDDVDPSELIDRAIRRILGCIAGLVRGFEGYREDAVYHANLALYVGVGRIHAMDKAEQTALWQRMRFSKAPEDDLLRGGGVLSIERRLSASTEAEVDVAPEDDGLEPLVFPIPVVGRRDLRGDKSRTLVLPGAPMAFCTAGQQEWIAFGSPDLLFEWCNERGAYDEQVLLKMREYFYNDPIGRTVQSFACVSIDSLDADDRDPIAVLNIHCNVPHMFKARQPAQHLVPLLQPFNSILAHLLGYRETVQGV